MTKKLIYKNGVEIKGEIISRSGKTVEVALTDGGYMFLEADSLKEVEEVKPEAKKPATKKPATKRSTATKKAEVDKAE